MGSLLQSLPFGVTLTAPEGPAWDFLVLFAVVILGPPLVQRARVPGIIGLLLGGFLIGPHGLGWIGEGNTTVPELGQLGLLYLMFVAGVELDLAILRVHRRSAITFGIATFAFPMVFGTIVGFALGWDAPAALLLGSLLASHTLLMYPAVREAGIAADPAIASAVGATVLTDTLALVVLAAVAGSEQGGGGPADVAVQIGLGLAVLLGFTLLVLPRLVRLAFRYLGSDRTIRYLLAVASFLAAATVAETFGIEGIVGAFFAGLALNRLVPNEGPLMERIDFFGSALFIPVFLVSVGLLLDPSVMVQKDTLGLAGLFIVACVGGKVIAAYLMRPAARLLAAAVGRRVRALDATGRRHARGDDRGLQHRSLRRVGRQRGARAHPRQHRPRHHRDGAREGPRAAAAHTAPRLGDCILVALQEPDQALAAMTIAARIAAPDGGVVHSVLASGAPEATRQQPRLTELREAALIAGVDTDPHLLVHGGLADAVVHASIETEASLVIAGESTSGGPSAFGTWGESVASAAPAPAVILRGRMERVDDVHLIQGGPTPTRALAPRPRCSPPSSRCASAALSVEVRERRDAEAIRELKRGELVIVPVASWELLEGLPAPPEGAGLLLVPEPAIAFAAAAGNLLDQIDLVTPRFSPTGRVVPAPSACGD